MLVIFVTHNMEESRSIGDLSFFMISCIRVFWLHSKAFLVVAFALILDPLVIMAPQLSPAEQRVILKAIAKVGKTNADARFPALCRFAGRCFFPPFVVSQSVRFPALERS